MEKTGQPMSIKRKVKIQHSDDLESVDAALTEAMAVLDEKNENVAGLLRTFEPPKQSEAADVSLEESKPAT